MHGYTPYIRSLQPGAMYTKKYHIGFPLSIHGGSFNTFYKSCLAIVTAGFRSAKLKQVSLMSGPPSMICTLYSSATMHWYTS